MKFDQFDLCHICSWQRHRSLSIFPLAGDVLSVDCCSVGGQKENNDLEIYGNVLLANCVPNFTLCLFFADCSY